MPKPPLLVQRDIPEIPDARIGVLGGSFNPAHDGHLFISRQALTRLKLDWVWWLVSPQNPLKSSQGMAPLETRMARARQMARHPRIRVTDIEGSLGGTYTANTLPALCHLYPRTRFVWLMGADNLLQISRWQHWREIFEAVPIAVLGRATYPHHAEQGSAAKIMAPFRIRERAAPILAAMAPPAWVVLHHRLHPESATRLRRVQQGN